MTKEEIASAFATIDRMWAANPATADEQQGRAELFVGAVIALATQVVVDLHRIADVAEQLALERTAEALEPHLTGSEAQPPEVGVYLPLPDGRSIPILIRIRAPVRIRGHDDDDVSALHPT